MPGACNLPVPEEGFEAFVVAVTAYRPDPERWSKDFLRRKL
jgi:hypothetical protein